VRRRRRREVTWPQDVTSGITTTYSVVKEEEVKGKHTHLNLDVRHTSILQRERERERGFLHVQHTHT